MFAPLKTETIQAFLDEARYLDTKPPESHYMGSWFCDTTSCAVGDMAARGVCGLCRLYGSLAVRLLTQTGASIRCDFNFDAVCRAFGITMREASYLFGREYFRRGNGEDYCPRDNVMYRGTWLDRSEEQPHQTAARIRKYLYYRMRKAEILADYEKARRTEGNWNVCPQAIEFSAAAV